MASPAVVQPEAADVRSLTEVRERQSVARLNERGTDLADLTDAEFERGLTRLKTVQVRMRRLLDEVLVVDAHYGNPNNAFKKPMLFKAGAEELRRLMRLSSTRTGPDQVIATAEYVQVVVTKAIYDPQGRFLAERKGSCTSKEKSFKGKGGEWIFDDAREILHTITAKAEKRADALLTLEAAGATAFLANADEMQEAAAAADRPLIPWTDVDRKQVYTLASAKGLSRGRLKALVLETLGREQIGTDDVPALLTAIAAWQKSGETSAAPAQTPTDGAPAPTDAADPDGVVTPADPSGPMTSGQGKLLRQLMRSSVYSDEERAYIEEVLTAEPFTAARAKALIEETMETIRVRKAAAKASPSPATTMREPGED